MGKLELLPKKNVSKRKWQRLPLQKPKKNAMQDEEPKKTKQRRTTSTIQRKMVWKIFFPPFNHLVLLRNDAAHAKVVKDYLIQIIVIGVGVGIGEQTEKSIRQWKKHWHNDVTMTSSLNQPFSVFTMIHSSST